MDKANKYNNLARRIIKNQSKLKRKNPQHSLLKLVQVDNISIHWTDEFGFRYQGIGAEEGLNQYVNGLEKATFE